MRLAELELELRLASRLPLELELRLALVLKQGWNWATDSGRAQLRVHWNSRNANNQLRRAWPTEPLQPLG